MPCFYPTGVKQDEPGEPVSFKFKGSQLDYDFAIGCGKCVGCRADQARDWATRLYCESLTFPQCVMLTLTYAPEHLPEDGKLKTDHCQKFIKRVRYHLGIPIRYFLCGEYGELAGRAHYHAIIYGTDFRGGAVNIGNNQYTNTILDELWGMGNVIGIPAEPASIAYVAGYTVKKLESPDTFALQSRKPPIGYEWAKQNAQRIAARGGNMTGMMTVGGNQVPIPKKFLDWFPDILSPVIDARREYVPPYKNSDLLRNREMNYKAKKALYTGQI